MAKQNRNDRIAQKRKQQQQQYLMYGVGIVLILVIAGALVYTLSDSAPEVSEVRLDQEAILGTAGAPVQVVEYGAYGCHSCRQVHESGLIDQVIDRYGDEIQFVFRNYPVINPSNDPVAAEAAQCALDQGDGAFWTFHNALYELSDNEYNSLSGENDYVTLAEEHGLNHEDLEACLDNNTHERTVDHWREQSERANLPGTPTFYVNGSRLSSASQLEDAILTELNEAG